jgi:hypothetical protein
VTGAAAGSGWAGRDLRSGAARLPGFTVMVRGARGFTLLVAMWSLAFIVALLSYN